MTADPESARQAEALQDVVWSAFPPASRTVPPQGLARTACRPPRQVSTVQCLNQVRRFPGRDDRTPGEARTWAADVCRVWRVPHLLVEDLKLIVSELATNAVTHATGDVRVGVSLTAHEVWVLVVDQGPRRRLQPQQAGNDDAHGRGLFLVDALATRFEATPDGDGTAVRACLELPPAWLAEDSAPAVHTPTQDGSTSHNSEDAADAPRSHN
ncbi:MULTISPECIES: ATP-binding protein [unclassified Streptomyces]|uniref:ATP-binding protein n=1 Tax=unclassified Streptomyces TaxID=2593676 RepID=UPI0036EC9B1B